MHWLESLVDVSFFEELHKRRGDHGFVGSRHGEVRVVPAPEHAKALEVAPVYLDVLLGVFPALAADVGGLHLGLAGA